MPPKRPKAPPPPTSSTRAVDVGRLVVRGLTSEDHAALDRVVERRRAALQKAAPGATLSQNAVTLTLLREAIARDEAASKTPEGKP
jgi:hypothetical protein